MDKKRTRLRLIPFWVIISVFIISSCSTEEMDNLQVEKNLSKEDAICMHNKTASAYRAPCALFTPLQNAQFNDNCHYGYNPKPETIF